MSEKELFKRIKIRVQQATNNILETGIRCLILISGFLFLVLGYYVFFIVLAFFKRKYPERIKIFERILEETGDWTVDWITIDELLKITIIVFILYVIFFVVVSI